MKMIRMRTQKQSKKRLNELLFTLNVLDDYVCRFNASDEVRNNQKKTLRRVKAMAKFLGVEVKGYKIVNIEVAPATSI